MPLYEYECDACGHRFERIRKFSDPPLTDCPECAGGLRKLLSPPAIQFKGTGWYVTDYARKSGEGGAAEGGKEASSANGADGKKASADGKTAADGASSSGGKSGSDGASAGGSSTGAGGSGGSTKPGGGSASSSSSAPG